MITPDKTHVLYGDRFVTNDGIRTTVMVVWAAPCTGGYEVDIPVGTVLVAQRDQVEEATSFNCIPENYKELEKRFVPASDRFAMKYSGYYPLRL